MIYFLVYWIVCLIVMYYFLWKMDWDAFDKKVVEKDARFNAIGQIPPGIRNFAFLVFLVFSPILTPLILVVEIKDLLFPKH